MIGSSTFCAIVLILFGNSAWSSSLTVRVSGIRSAAGTLRLSLFRSAEGFPEDYSKAARTLSLPAKDTVVLAEFAGLDPGSWALAVLHDENRNGRLDRNLLGVPREGIGASNGATRTFGPPRFADAVFPLRKEGGLQEVILLYW